MPTLATTPELNLLDPESNGGRYQPVTLTLGLDFVFVRSGDPLPRRVPVRLFGDHDPERFLVEEVSNGDGSVPYLRARNESPIDVFLLAGQLVRGGKQNRGINADLLVGAGTSATIPVTCVEQGRWSGTPRSRFQHGGIEPLSLRSMKMREAHAARRRGAEAHADQRAVWSEIAHLSESISARSASSDLLHALEVHKSRRASGLAEPSGAADGALEGELRDAETRLHEFRSAAIDAMARWQSDLSRPDMGGDVAPTPRPPLELILRQLSRAERDVMRLRAAIEAHRAAPRPTVGGAVADDVDGADTKVDLAGADAAAAGASGMLVFFNGDFLAGDLFADPAWFAKVYGDLRDSALLSWEVASRRWRRIRPMSADAAERAASGARAIVRDALEGDWRERPSVAEGRSRLLEHPSLESAVLSGRDEVPLHMLIGTKEIPEMLRNPARGEERPRV